MKTKTLSLLSVILGLCLVGVTSTSAQTNGYWRFHPDPTTSDGGYERPFTSTSCYMSGWANSISMAFSNSPKGILFTFDTDSIWGWQHFEKSFTWEIEGLGGPLYVGQTVQITGTVGHVAPTGDCGVNSAEVYVGEPPRYGEICCDHDWCTFDLGHLMSPVWSTNVCNGTVTHVGEFIVPGKNGLWGDNPLGQLIIYCTTADRRGDNAAVQYFYDWIEAPTITSDSALPAGTVGIAYSQSLLVTNGMPPYVWSVVSNSLPAGLYLTTTGAITGTPTTATIANFRVQVTETNNLSDAKDFSLTITAPTPTRIIGLSGNLNFGSVTVNTTAQRTLTITNSGNASLTVTNISYPLGFTGAWSGSIPAGGAQGISVTFAPVDINGYGGEVTVNSDKTDGTETISASGIGVASPPPFVVTDPFAVVVGLPVVLAGTTNSFVTPPFWTGWTPTTCNWDFSDGSTSTNCSPSHAYTNCQTYTVSYSGSDGVTAHATNVAVVVPCELGVTNKGTKVQAKLNFAVPGKDSYNLAVVADLGADFIVSNKTVLVSFGGVETSFVLDPKGKGVSYPNSCTLKYNITTGLWTLKVKCKSGNWHDQWAAHNMTDETVAKPGRLISIPVVVFIGNEAFAAEKTLYYTANMGKSGSAK